MDAREARFAIGFILLGLTPLLATAGGTGLGALIFSAGLLIATSAAFA